AQRCRKEMDGAPWSLLAMLSEGPLLIPGSLRFTLIFIIQHLIFNISMSTSLHFIGIGGSGISALAQWFLAQGQAVSGSDAGQNATTEDLKKQGIQVFLGHQKKHLPPQTSRVIYTEAIDKTTNPEYLEAKKREIP